MRLAPAASPVEPFGDRAFLAPVGDVAAARAFAAAVAQAAPTGPLGTEEIETLTGLDSVVVCLGTGPDATGEIETWLSDLVASRHRGPVPVAGGGPVPGETRRIDIPVHFDGPDLAAVASALGTTPSSVVEALTGARLEVAIVGFAPGFAYLAGLPDALAAVPRRRTPRPAVPAGSVAIGGGFAAVYPRSSPGGWMVLGHTATRLFDAARPPFALLQPGDSVRFTPDPRRGGGPDAEGRDAERPDAVEADSTAAGSAATPARPLLAASGVRAVEVVEPGLLSLVEDAGRRGVARLGVPDAGPADPESMKLANRLVGNADDAACIEVTARGPTLRFAHEAHAAVVACAPDGIDVRLDGHPAGADLVVPVQPGQTLAVGRVREGLRAYVALSGGLETPVVVGSRSSDLLTGLGPGALLTGDRLGLGSPGRPHGHLSRPPDEPRPGHFRVVLGPHGFPEAATRALCSGDWTVRGDSNRIGLRLAGASPIPADRPAITSTGMITGAVQVPPDGHPIVLMVDHATLGGYPVIACVISADLPRLGQLQPGDRLAFSPVGLAEARAAQRHREHALARSVSGWFPTEAAT